MNQSTALCIDRYHAVMGNFALRRKLEGLVPDRDNLGDLMATFYVTQRKLPYTVALGHDRLINLLNRSRADVPMARYLKEDRAHLDLIAEELQRSRFPGTVDAVPQGTIIFAGQPIALVSGPFAVTQLYEVAFEHAFDEPMTFCHEAMKMKEIAGPNIFVSDFSLRRAGGLERAVLASTCLYIGGCDDTSNMEAGFQLDIPSIGTMAHYLVQIYMAMVAKATREDKIPKEWYDEAGNIKHGQRICFEDWLYFHPQGTVCLIDTIDVKLGMIHVIEAALNSEARRKALKAVRIDSGDLAANILFIRAMLDANGLTEVKIIPTGDLNSEKLKKIAERLWMYYITSGAIDAGTIKFSDYDGLLTKAGVMGVAGGTKFAAEFEKVAGVIFKMIEVENEPTLKLSGTPGKETLPGKLQLWRFENADSNYLADVTAMANEAPTAIVDFPYHRATALIQSFWEQGKSPELKTVQELKKSVEQQKMKFTVSLAEYAKKRVFLSSKLTKLKQEISDMYQKSPATNIEVVDFPIILGG